MSDANKTCRFQGITDILRCCMQPGKTKLHRALSKTWPKFTKTYTDVNKKRTSHIFFKPEIFYFHLPVNKNTLKTRQS